MTKTIAAVYEKGVLRPVEPLPLAEGERVEVTVRTEGLYPSSQQLLESFQQVAAIPETPPDDGLSAADHDKILYGGKEGPA